MDRIFTKLNENDIVDNIIKENTKKLFNRGNSNEYTFDNINKRVNGWDTTISGIINSTRAYTHFYSDTDVEDDQLEFTLLYCNNVKPIVNSWKINYKKYESIIFNRFTDHSFQNPNEDGDMDDFIILDFSRNNTLSKINNNLEITLGSGTHNIKLVVDENSKNEFITTQNGNYNIVNGDVYTLVDNGNNSDKLGYLFSNLGIVILDARSIYTSAGFAGTFPTLASFTSANYDTYIVGSSADNSLFYGDNATETKIENAYSVEIVKYITFFCRLYNNKYNFSNNPTWIDTDTYSMKSSLKMAGNPQTYPTTIGLYDDDNNLLVVAKLNRPYRKNFEQELTFQIKIEL